MPHPKGYDIPAPEHEQEFEDLCVDLMTARHRPLVPSVPFGTRGDKQHGLDFVVQVDAELHGYQCKRVTSFPWPKFEAEVAKLVTYPNTLAGFVVLATCPANSAVQAKVDRLSVERQSRGQCPVSIIYWKTLRDWLVEHKDVWSAHYPDMIGDQRSDHGQRVFLVDPSALEELRSGMRDMLAWRGTAATEAAPVAGALGAAREVDVPVRIELSAVQETVLRAAVRLEAENEQAEMSSARLAEITGIPGDLVSLTVDELVAFGMMSRSGSDVKEPLKPVLREVRRALTMAEREREGEGDLDILEIAARRLGWPLDVTDAVVGRLMEAGHIELRYSMDEIRVIRALRHVPDEAPRDDWLAVVIRETGLEYAVASAALENIDAGLQKEEGERIAREMVESGVLEEIRCGDEVSYSVAKLPPEEMARRLGVDESEIAEWVRGYEYERSPEGHCARLGISDPAEIEAFRSTGRYPFSEHEWLRRMGLTDEQFASARRTDATVPASSGGRRVTFADE